MLCYWKTSVQKAWARLSRDRSGLELSLLAAKSWTPSAAPQTEIQSRDPSFPLEETKSPRPENPRKLLKNYNLAHPGPVLKITEKLLKNYKNTEKLLKNYIFSNFLAIFR